MFENRVKVVLYVLALLAVVLVVRLADLQIVDAHQYRQQVERVLRLRPRTLEPLRGRILDRLGRELAADEPCWDVRVAYGILSMDDHAVHDWARKLDRSGYYGGDLRGLAATERLRRIETRLRRDVDHMWDRLAHFSGLDRAELTARSQRIRRRVTAIRDAVEKRLRYTTRIREERMFHTILSGLDDQDQIAARSNFGDYPWVSVDNASQRVYAGDPSFAHILGRMGPVTAAQLKRRRENKRDATAETDELRRYRATDRLGISGVEHEAEYLLRGRRGVFQKTLRGDVIENIPPRNGRDIHLTIRTDLQQSVYRMFAGAIDAIPDAPGGAIVVLSVPTREVLAMVSYPAYDPNRFSELYDALRRDVRHQPLRFRAVSNQYAPGSIVKPLVCLAGLNTGALTLDTRIDCEGYMFPNNHSAWRCWAPSGSSERKHHGPITATEAIKYSCNIFVYHTAQRVGVQRLCEYFDMAGFGKTSTGLVEEAPGLVPWPSWLTRRGQSVTAGKARHLGIGQAELSITPLQAANLTAVYAEGKYRPVTLVQEMARDVYWQLPGCDANWRAIRRGMYGVVNDSDGTAHSTAYWKNPHYALCGKTGSAQTARRAVEYSVQCADAHESIHPVVIPADSKRVAEDILTNDPQYADCAFDRNELTAHAWWPVDPPPTGRMYSHAWFIGYLQPLDPLGQPLLDRTPPIAFAVMVEYGGSGGRVSAPIGRKLAQILVDTLGPQLDPDAPPREVTP